MPTQQSSTQPPAEFPQPHSGHLIDNLLGLVDEISARAARVAALDAALHAMDGQGPLQRFPLEDCQFEDEGWPCYHPGVVFHLGSEQEFCRRHFQAVERG